MSDNKEFEWTDELVKEWSLDMARKVEHPDIFGGWEGYEKEINKWQKSKQRTVLFTTEDGVEIFEGDLFYCVMDFVITKRMAENDMSYDLKKCKDFSTEERAKKYIEWNKEILSLAEIMANSDLYEGPTYCFDRDKLEKLAQQKIK